MKTKVLFQTTGLTCLMMFLTTLFLNAQIPIQGLAGNHEGTAAWDADGTGPEPEAYGHVHPFGYGSSLYYSASRDYIDTHPDAALCHFLDDIEGFPLFVQALADNGFTTSQIKVKTDLYKMNDDVEGEDWFTINDMHYLNRYDANYYIELNSETMITGYIDYFISSDSSDVESWYLQSNFTMPVDASENSSSEIQEVAAAFISDMNGQELRFIFDDIRAAGGFLSTHGRLNGAYFSIISGYLEKGLPELPFVGLEGDHEGLAGWDADGSGPEPEADGHTFYYDGFTYWMAYYIASRDYDGIDDSNDAALGHFIDDVTDFPNLEIQLTYRGFNIDQLKLKSGICTSGNNIKGEDWDTIDGVHWYNHYGNTVTIEIAGEPILKYTIDTNFSSNKLDLPDEDWWSNSTYSTVFNVLGTVSDDAQYVAASFLKDLGDHSIKSTMEGHYIEVDFFENGRDGAFHEISSGTLVAGYIDSLTTHVNESMVNLSKIRLLTYPNPISNFTTIEYELNQPETVTITFYNQFGKQVDVIEERQQKGLNKVLWNPKNLADGIYYFKLQAGEQLASGKVVLVR